MSGFAFLALVIGALTLLGLYLLLRQLERGRQSAPASLPRTVSGENDSDAVLVISEVGQVLHANPLALAWLNLEPDSLDLETVAARMEPAENFFALLTGQTSSTFRIGSRYVNASVFYIPDDNGVRALITMREAGQTLMRTSAVNVSQAIELINKINANVRAEMSVESVLQVLLDLISRTVNSDAGEICLWDAQREFLVQRGWVGDTAYVVALAEHGGGYHSGQGVAGWVLKTQRPLLLNGSGVDHRELLAGTGFVSAVSIPLSQADEFIGTLTLFNSRPINFDEGHVALLDAVQKVVSAAIVNAQLYNQQERRLNDLASLQDVAQSEGDLTRVSDLYLRLNTRIADMLEAEMSGVFLYDRDRGELLPQLPFYGLNDSVASRIVIPLPPNSPQHDIWRDQPYWASNALVEEPLVEALGLRSLLEVAGIRSTLLVPMSVGRERIGFIAVSNKRSRKPFLPSDIQSLRVLSAQATTIVENIRLYERGRLIDSELVGLQEMTDAISAVQHIDEFYASVTERMARLMRCQIAVVLLYDEATNALQAQSPAYGLAEEVVQAYRVALGEESILRRVWRESDWWLSNRADIDASIYEAGLDAMVEAGGVRKLMFAVMRAGGRKIGMVQVANPVDGRDLGDSDVRLLQIFATQASAVIENARLYREVAVRAEQADGLREVAELASAVITPDQPFTPVLEAISRFMNSPVVYITIIDHTTNNLISYPRYIYGVPNAAAQMYEMSANPDLKYAVALTKRPYISNDVLNDKRVITNYRSTAQRYNFRRAVLVPLLVGDRSIGELGVANRDGLYDQQDVVLLSTVASQIAAALERLLLYESTGENLRRRMRELDAIARVSNELAMTLDLDSVLEKIRAEVRTTLNCHDATVVLLRPADTWLSPDAPQMERRLGLATLPTMAPIELQAVAHPLEPVKVDDYQQHPLEAQPYDARSAIAATIRYLDEVVGVLHAYALDAHHFNEDSVAFLVTIASKAALGYQNAAYYQQQIERGDSLRQRVDQLNRIFELGQMLQTSTDLESLLEAVAYSVQQSVGYDTVLMLMVDEDEGVLRRTAQAGIPIMEFERSRGQTTTLDTLMEFLKPEFRVGESYFFPIEREAEWLHVGLEALDTAHATMRTIEPRGKDDWHDGDRLIVLMSGQGGNLIGAMVLDRPHDNKRPDRSRMEVLEIFAHQASTMVENTRLFLESRRAAEQEAQLNAIMNAVASTLDLSEIARAIASGIRRLVPLTRLTLAVANPTTRLFDYLRVSAAPDDSLSVAQETRASLERTALGRAYDTRQVGVYTLGDREVAAWDDVRDWHKQGERATIVLPLVAGGECLGAIHFGSEQDRAVTAQEVRSLIERVSQLVAGALQNARLFNQAVNLQVLNRSVVESIQQGIVVLDSSGRIINVNEFMREAYGWDDSALQQDLFAYQPELSDVLGDALSAVLEDGQPRERRGFTSINVDGSMIVRDLYLYALRAGESIRGAVLLVDDVTDRTRMEQSIEARANQLAALTEVSTRITGLLEREEIITLAIEEMAWVIAYDTMSIWRRVGSFMVLEGARGFANSRDLLNTRLAISESEPVQHIIETQRALALTAEADLSSLRLPPEEPIGSWLGVPLVTQGNVVGLIMLTRRDENAYQTREEQHVVFAFASQVAIALSNAELFEQTFERTNELGMLLEAAQATSLSRDVNEVFRTVALLMFNALEQENATILTWHEVDNELEVDFTTSRDGAPNAIITTGKRYDLRQYPARQRAIIQRDVVVIMDHPHEAHPPQYDLELQELRAMGRGARMFIPLVVSDRVIGLIQLEQTSSSEQSITQQKVRLAKALGAQVAVAIENARLSAETRVRFEELITINSLSQAISSTLKLEDMLPIIRDQVPAVTKAEEMYLALYDEERDLITFPLAVREGRSFTMPPRLLGNDEVSYIIKRKRTLNLGADYFSIDDLRRSLGIVNGEGEAKSYLGVPLVSGDQVLGVLAIRSNTRSRAFNVNDDRILTTVGSQLSAAIQNARLFERVTSFADELNALVRRRTDELQEERDRLDTLYRITSELARTLDMEQLLDRALRMVSQAVGAEDGVILLSDPATDSLYPRAWLDDAKLVYDSNGKVVSHPAIGFAEWFLMSGIETQNVMMVPDLADEPYWQGHEHTNMRSAIAVILENNEDPMGVMVLLSGRVGAFTESHVKLLVPAANQVAASINSADLYQLIRDQAERLGRLLRAEQEEAQKQGAILEGINDGVMLADAQGRVVLFNSAAERILGLPRSQILKQHVSRLGSYFTAEAYEWQRFVKQLSDNIDGKMVEGAYISERVELNDYFITTYLTPVSSNDQFLGVLAVFRDVTKDVEAERAKNQFITNVSHEFRTPLTPIKGFTDLLLMGAGGNLSDSQQQMVETIKQNVDRLTLLVNDVLNISKLDSRDLVTTMQMVELPELLRGTLEAIAGRATNAQRGFTTRTEIAPDLPRIRADRDKLIQIVSNLIDNAFKYTLAGGTITVGAALEQDHQHVLIRVQDTGVGIPDEFKERAFNRFERYDKHALELDVAGTGLGLALVKELVLLHHGEVWFESEEGKGTTFFVRLPVEQPNYISGTLMAVSGEPQTRE
jgi:PAS domain S-box-containing protein